MVKKWWLKALLMPDPRQGVILGGSCLTLSPRSGFVLAAEEEMEGQAALWCFGLCKPVGCNARAETVRSEAFWQFTKAQVVLFRIWQVRG